jgi:AraC-like DNA-binding protein
VVCELVLPAEVVGDWIPIPYTSPIDKLYLPQQGHARVTIDRHVYPLRPGQAMLIPAGCVHAARVTSRRPMRKTYAHFHATTAERVPALRLMDTPRVVGRGTAARVAELTDALLAEWARARLGRSLLAQSLLLQVVVAFLRAPASHRVRPLDATARPAAATDDARYDAVRRVIDHVHATADRPVTLDDLADVAGWTPAHLTRTFRRLVGVPAMKYVERVRIGRARERLAASPDPVHAVAARCGYPDPAYFSRAFTRCVGVSPAAYRRRHRLDPAQNNPTTTPRPSNDTPPDPR